MHVGLAPMQSRLQARTVQFVAIDGFDRRLDSSDPIPWEIVADCVEKLVARPDLFLVFLSPQSAATFRQAVAVPRMARLVSQGRLKYVLEEEGGINGTWRLVEPDGDGGWRVVGMFSSAFSGTIHSQTAGFYIPQLRSILFQRSKIGSVTIPMAFSQRLV